MSCSIQWIKDSIGIIRHHQNGGKFGDEYNWFCVVERDGHMATLHGALEIPKQIRNKVKAALVIAGFDVVRWYRIGKGWVEFNLTA